MPSSKPTPVTMDAVYTAPGYLFRRMQQIAVALFIEECSAFDLTPVQYAALVTISTHPGIDATRLSAVIAFDRSTLGNVIERLEAKGWATLTWDGGFSQLHWAAKKGRADWCGWLVSQGADVRLRNLVFESHTVSKLLIVAD